MKLVITQQNNVRTGQRKWALLDVIGQFYEAFYRVHFAVMNKGSMLPLKGRECVVWFQQHTGNNPPGIFVCVYLIMSLSFRELQQ